MPRVDPDSSAATSTMSDTAMAWRTPARMKGRAAGRITRNRVRTRPAPSAAAERRYTMFVSRTPMNVVIQMGKNAPHAISAIFGSSPMPNQSTARGTTASEGTERKPCSTGSLR
ncbi:hypothetical protein D3C85_1442670 [compost metagenome]